MSATPTLIQCMNLLNQKKHVEALDVARQLVGLNPDDAKTMLFYGHALLANNLFAEALDAWIKTDELVPQSILIIQQMATIARELGRNQDALTYYGRALEISPTTENIEACGNLMLEIGHIHEAEQLLMLASSKGNLRAVAGLVDLRVKQGRQPEAADLISEHIQRLGEEPALVQSCARLMLAEREYDSALEALGMIDFKQLPTNAKLVHIRLLGDALDKLGRHSEAFDAYTYFNTLRGSSYDSTIHFTHLQNVKSTHLAYKAIQSTNESNRPIFIIGMPRSGTSLLEQILSMHTDIYGGGELDHLPAFIKQYGVDSVESLNAIADNYLSRVNLLNDTTPFVTDKLPHNYENLGNIARIFPNAKIIYCTRDPIDIGWSCYRQNFHNSYSFATDLWSIGDYHRQLTDLMAHWKATLDIPIHEVSYEDLIQSPESIVRSLLKFCGVAWDPNVLNFHTSDRVVHTASSVQVQKPLYATSIGGSKPYTEWLEPLRKGLQGQPRDK